MYNSVEVVFIFKCKDCQYWNGYFQGKLLWDYTKDVYRDISLIAGKQAGTCKNELLSDNIDTTELTAYITSCDFGCCLFKPNDKKIKSI